MTDQDQEVRKYQWALCVLNLTSTPLNQDNAETIRAVFAIATNPN